MVGKVYITEKPVIVETGSTFRKPSFSDPADQKILYGKAWLPSMQRIVDRSPLNMNIIVLNGFNHIQMQFIDLCKTKMPQQKIQELENCLVNYGIVLEDRENRVNMILTHNSGPNRLPLTPWITFHRAMHAFQLGHADMISSKIVEQMSYDNFALMHMFKNEKPPANQDYSVRNVELARLIGDTRTLRTGQHLNSSCLFVIDLIAEIWTEYLVKGKMTIKIDAVEKKYRDFSTTSQFVRLINNLEKFQIFLREKFREYVESKVGDYAAL